MANSWLLWLTLSAVIAASYSETSAGQSPAHNSHVCSTWGNFHFKIFDGDLFQLPSSCNYVLTSECSGTYKNFNVQLRRGLVNGEPTISKVVMMLDGTALELVHDGVVVNGEPVTLPFSQSGVLIEKAPTYIKIKANFGLTAIWNEEDAFLVELDAKYKNHTCGLCGDFNGVHNEFHSHGIIMSPQEYASFWKSNGPTETCDDYALAPKDDCTNVSSLCEQLLAGPAFSSCQALLNVTSFSSACVADVCHCSGPTATTQSDPLCLCDTLSEFSRQCVQAGGKPDQWRTRDLCWKTCPLNMEHQECGSPCANTCSNPESSQTCASQCRDGCFCPAGMVLDDVTNQGCVPLKSCPCSYNGKAYMPGESYISNCKQCMCNGGGQWDCKDKMCPGTCSVEGGSHINTFDDKDYTFHGDCSYTLAKDCDGNQFHIQGDLVQCGLSDSETCLRSVTLALIAKKTVITIQTSGKVFVNGIYTQLPFSAAGIAAFRASSFYLMVHTDSGLQMEVQLLPIMQLYITISNTFMGKTCGLCGNFNKNQADDFLKLSGVVDATSAGFANSWKTNGNCLDIKSKFENPCSRSLENEKYANRWCTLLIDPTSVFGPCHSEISPETYRYNCMYDSCNCEDSEACMCAAVSSYVHACAAAGIQLPNWRNTVCGKYASACDITLVYSYDITKHSRTCRCLSQSDLSCHLEFPSVDGCTCAEGMYLSEAGKCVPASGCPCYDLDSVVLPGQVVNKDGVVCTCNAGKLTCIGQIVMSPTCLAPMLFFDCSAAGPKATGTECEKSCATLDLACVSTGCVSGCVCPSGMVSDDNGQCITIESCPCVQNGAIYKPGESMDVDCNTCTCKDRLWHCTSNLCYGSCSVYGDGHFITFDKKRFNFDGSCEYTLAQDHCLGNNGTFRVVIENVPCGTTGTTCSKTIKVYLEKAELILTEGTYQIISNGQDGTPFHISTMGIYLVIEAKSLILMWDKKTSIFIKLSPHLEGRVCGLCGNYDGKTNNDFTTRNNALVVNPLEFGNSWKDSPSCPDAVALKNPCTLNPYRKPWAEKQCSIIQSAQFSGCHSVVDPSPYYDACVFDSCACDTGGDCECFCTAVAAYAQACNEAGACISWRTPKICPLFCDYYNPAGECDWHYKPCGSPCMKTCKNPSGGCSTQIPPLEGCYPKCPPEQPFFDEVHMKCVSKDQCGCYDRELGHYNNGDTVPTTRNCYSCMCNSTTIQCNYDVQACTCTYNGNIYSFGETIYNTTDSLGYCITAVCGMNGICYGWGHPHYVTFDGTYYGFQGNCSYWLVKEMNPKYNFSVVIENYLYMGHEWRTNDTDCDPPIQPTGPVCINPPLCDIISSSVFESCHPLVPFEHYKEACIFDGCNTQLEMGCTSIQAYAAACNKAGVCIDWRNNTDGICEYKCIKPKVYEACGPAVELTCNISYNYRFIYNKNLFTSLTDLEVEGCNCPPGTILLNSASNICLPTCDVCLLQNGVWKMVNETWRQGCEVCTCLGRESYTCQNVSCPTEPPISCDKEGQITVTETVDCCSKPKCACDTQTCYVLPVCPLGYKLTEIMGVCCPKYSCVPRPNVCVYGNREYQVGDTVIGPACHTCNCTDEIDSNTQLHIVKCQPIQCDTQCPLGYEHETNLALCCGVCVQKRCVAILPDNTTHTIEPGTIWKPPGFPCQQYECLKIGNQFETIVAKIICPPYDPSKCIPGTETLAPGGCCLTCIPTDQPCTLTTVPITIENQGCRSKEQINLTSCTGACSTYTYWSMVMKKLDHTCSCCQEISTTKRIVQLICPNGTEVDFEYLHINNCSCLKTDCINVGFKATAHRSKSGRRRRR
ncbi:hypothetical protein NHX12_006464 [Muraenolepis orangiensis]|uniref:Mucin-5B n=1 Tax=Muraenolepis orangiensis TaxID=630683 RepID=A0A9Q0IBA0_9TELE|nr:hypothetical protein NHX12_006464 [Muraenolepis orangiensis]